MLKWLVDVLMYSTYNEDKSAVAAKFIRFLKGELKIHTSKK